MTYTRLEGDVRLQNVDFGYELGKTVLHNISLYAKPGQKVAFVGATGAGKTTITNLLNRFYDIADGKIRYDGSISIRSGKVIFAVPWGSCSRTPTSLPGSVMENIRYGKLDATDEECIAAAKLAGADDFITRLPEGLIPFLQKTAQPVSGTAAASVHCQGGCGRSAGHDPGRGHFLHRYPYRRLSYSGEWTL